MIKQDHQVKKRAKGREGNFKKNSKQVAAPGKKPKARPKTETECFYCKGNGHWKQNYAKYLVDKNDGKVNKGIFDIHVIDMYFASFHSNPKVFDISSVAKISNSKQDLQNNREQLRAR